MRRKFSLVSMGGRAEGLACADTGARTPIGASGNLLSEQSSTDDNIPSETISLPRAVSSPAAPMQIRKKRGIITDGLVQIRLATFGKSFPNLKSKFDTGES